MQLLSMFSGGLWLIPVLLFAAGLIFTALSVQKSLFLRKPVHKINESFYALAFIFFAILSYLAIKFDWL